LGGDRIVDIGVTQLPRIQMIAQPAGFTLQIGACPYMKLNTLLVGLVGAMLLVAGSARAQGTAPAPYPLDIIPEKIAFNTPYGTPISLERAQAVVQAAIAEAKRRGWLMNIAVLDSGANLVAFARMDNAALSATAVSQHKARAAVKYRRPTKVFEEALQKGGFTYVLTLDDVVAARGGIPLIEDGKLIGAIGVSGGAGSQDEVVSMAGAAVVNK
jgi:glc operon protein GlcG